MIMVTIKPKSMRLVFILYTICLAGSINFILMLLRREAVKRDLRARCYSPVSIRWRPFAREVLGWRTRSHMFQVVFADFLGNIRTTRCYFRQRMTGFPRSEIVWTEPETLRPPRATASDEN
jgi:hypothetical protein